MARNGPRKTVFGAALHQAEDLFRSSEGLGPASRPINIFYGLSQATRALAAAGVPDKTAWQLRGHGITHHKGLDRALSSIRFMQTLDARGAYTTLAGLLGSPTPEEPVLLVDALSALPHSPSGESWKDLVRPLSYRHQPQGMDGAFFVHSKNYFVQTAGWPEPPSSASSDLLSLRRWARKYLEKYFPVLAKAHPLPDEYRTIQHEEGSGVLTLKFESEESLGTNWQREILVRDLGTKYGEYAFIFPRFTGLSQPHHPLLIWWASLWCFSMLSRYEPSRWSSVIDVDSSKDAVGIETLLEDSLDMVPALILRELTRFQ
ncbi:YaaC family protein [Arthrobacter sp. BL-252-APC-1A]|uniref:YaaC family protein n=1 Tax=Arthrobacter sp. BL-252-APC-1A TaxID=2606622 RepID=UPI003FA3D82E